MANSVNPDQTAPLGAVWSKSALFAHFILSETLVYKIYNKRSQLFYNQHVLDDKKCHFVRNFAVQMF